MSVSTSGNSGCAGNIPEQFCVILVNLSLLLIAEEKKQKVCLCTAIEETDLTMRIPGLGHARKINAKQPSVEVVYLIFHKI